MFTIFDNITKERVSPDSYTTSEEANHDYYMNAGHTHIGVIPVRTFFAVVDAAGEFKRSGRFDTGEFTTQREAEAFIASLSNPEDYTVKPFTEVAA